MPLSQSALSNGLQNLSPTSDEATAIQAFADAWESYFAGASVSGVALSGTTASAKAAMIGAMTGLSQSGQGAAKIAAGITQWWSTLAPLGATLWTIPPNVITPPLVPPTGLGAIAAALANVFASNTSGSSSLSACASQIAAILHTNGGIGGIAVVQPPPVAPPVPTPIL